MKKSTLTVLCGLAFLSACGGKDADPVPQSEDVTPAINALAPAVDFESRLAAATGLTFSTAQTRVLFNPASNIVSLPYFTFFSGTVDGTASVTIDEASPPNPALDAINDLDGWSTNAPVNIDFKGSLNETTPCSTYTAARTLACLPNVFLIPLNVADITNPETGEITRADPLNPATINTADPVNTPAYSSTQVQANAVTLEADNDSLRISPVVPLENQTLYLLAITNGVLDGSNQPVGPSPMYQVLSDITDTEQYNALGYPAAFEALRAAIMGSEQIALATINATLTASSAPTITQDDIVYTHLFTTTHAAAPLVALAHPSSLDPTNPSLAAFDSVYTPSQTSGFYSDGLLRDVMADTVKAPLFSTSEAKLVQGVMLLPSYLEIPATMASTQAQIETVQNDRWTPSSEILTPPQDIDTFTTTINGTRTQTSTNVTYRFPFPALQETPAVPVTVVTPEGNKPATGWPVVVMVHGINQDRGSLLAMAARLADACNETSLNTTPECFASVMIDLPLHGLHSGSFNPELDTFLPGSAPDVSSLPSALQTPIERHFGLTYNAAGASPQEQFLTTSVAPSSGSLFINLSNFQNTRDHLKQSVVDQLVVLASLNGMDVDGNSDNGADFDTNKVFLVGHSIGAMVGLTTTAVANAGSTAGLPRVQAAALLNAGGQLTRLLENSPNPNFGAAAILQGLQANGLTQNTKDFEAFFNIFQASIDSGDPVNFAALLATTNTPAYFTIMVGDGTAGTDDQVVPVDANNNPTPPLGDAIAAPLAGSQPLVRLAGAVDLSAGDYSDGDDPVFGSAGPTDPKRVTVRFTDGTHSTAVFPSPGDEAVFTDMVNHISTFFSLNGRGIEVTNTSAAVQ